MVTSKLKLVLASGSPRRKELLASSFLKFDILVSDIEENSNEVLPHDIAMDLAFQKASAIAKSLKDPSKVILGADTIVVFENEILGKPIDKSDAKLILQKLSGKTHIVYTGVSISCGDKHVSFYEETHVTFRTITSDLLDLYLETGDSLDKAGAYGIQGAGLSFIEKINGSYSNVVGLPIDKVIIELKKILGKENDNTGDWRKNFV